MRNAGRYGGVFQGVTEIPGCLTPEALRPAGETLRDSRGLRCFPAHFLPLLDHLAEILYLRVGRWGTDETAYELKRLLQTWSQCSPQMIGAPHQVVLMRYSAIPEDPVQELGAGIRRLAQASSRGPLQHGWRLILSSSQLPVSRLLPQLECPQEKGDN